MEKVLPMPFVVRQVWYQCRTNDTLILQRTEKQITNFFNNWDWRRPKKLVLLREKKIKSTCLPVLDIQRDTEINSIEKNPYCGVIPLSAKSILEHKKRKKEILSVRRKEKTFLLR
jgi:hypothetical protein